MEHSYVDKIDSGKANSFSKIEPSGFGFGFITSSFLNNTVENILPEMIPPIGPSPLSIYLNSSPPTNLTFIFSIRPGCGIKNPDSLHAFPPNAN